MGKALVPYTKVKNKRVTSVIKKTHLHAVSGEDKQMIVFPSFHKELMARSSFVDLVQVPSTDNI